MGDKTKSGNTESIMGTRPGGEGGLRLVRHIVQLLGSGLKDEMSLALIVFKVDWDTEFVEMEG